MRTPGLLLQIGLLVQISPSLLQESNVVLENLHANEVNVHNSSDTVVVNSGVTINGTEVIVTHEVITSRTPTENSSDATSTTAAPSESTTKSSITLDMGLDARQEIANYNRFMDEIFSRMNLAIRGKNLDPMDLKLLPNGNTTSMTNITLQHIRDMSLAADTKTHLFSDPSKPKPATEPVVADSTPSADLDGAQLLNETLSQDIRGWLYGMSSLKRSGDVSISIREDHRTVECPFSLGPLELKVSRTVGSGATRRTKSATATTDLMLGLMDLRVDRTSGQIEITNVYFDEPGGVDVKGNIKRRVEEMQANMLKPKKKGQSPYRLVLAQQAALSIKKVARLVASAPLATAKAALADADR